MLQEIVEIEVHLECMDTASEADKAPVLAMLQNLKNHVGLEASVPIAKELVGDYKAGEHYVETVWPHVLKPGPKYVGFDFLRTDDKLLGKAKDQVDKANPGKHRSQGGQQVQQNQRQQHHQQHGHGDRRYGRDGKRSYDNRGGYEGRGGGQYNKRPRDEGRHHDGDQYLPGPPRY